MTDLSGPSFSALRGSRDSSPHNPLTRFLVSLFLFPLPSPPAFLFSSLLINCLDIVMSELITPPASRSGSEAPLIETKPAALLQTASELRLRLDTLLEQYLALLNKQQQLQSGLAKQMSLVSLLGPCDESIWHLAKKETGISLPSPSKLFLSSWSTLWCRLLR